MKNTKTLTRVALLVAIELVMKMVGLGSVPVGPLYMSFLTLPIAVGAITMGPAVGALLGGVFGAVSFYDAITGASAMTGALFQVSPVNTFILCVGMRVLMGLCCGLIFSSLKRFDKPGTWSYIVSAMSAPFLNTVFFMGWIVLAFYGCDYVQNLVSVKGAANPFMFVVLLVGVQGVAEFLVSGILGGIVATLGVVFPSLMIIAALAGVITTFSHLAWVQHAFAGIRVCVCVLIFNAVLKLWKGAVKDVWGLVIFLVILALSVFTKLSPIIYVLAAAVAGLLIKNLGAKRS